MTFRPQHVGLYFTHEHITAARRDRDRDPLRAAYLMLNDREQSGMEVALWGAFRYRFNEDERAGEIAADLFGDLTLLEPVSGVKPPVVALNWPFSGGYILSRYTTAVPGIMVEINRGLFVGNQSTDTPISPPNGNVIAAIRLRLFQWLTAILAEL